MNQSLANETQIDKFRLNCQELNCTCKQPVNKLSQLHKRVNTEAAAHRCSAPVLKNQRQPLKDVFQIDVLKNY